MSRAKILSKKRILGLRFIVREINLESILENEQLMAVILFSDGSVMTLNAEDYGDKKVYKNMEKFKEYFGEIDSVSNPVYTSLVSEKELVNKIKKEISDVISVWFLEL